MGHSANRYRAVISLSVVLVALMGCRHEPNSVANTSAKLVWGGFGKPAPGKIAVTVSGDVRHPGRYHLEQGASLESLPYAVGGWGGHGDMHAPPTRASVSGKNRPAKTEYRIFKMTIEERESVKLQDGDTVEYPAILF